MSEGAFATTPYKGLMPYSEADAPFFFGRDAEREIIIANLMASRLTLFYGPSGVGKSSVLRAGVAHHLRRLARENLDETGSPGLAVVVFNSWRDDPVAGLEARARDSALLSLNGQTVEPVPASGSLSETFRAWTERLGGDLLIILDQFEEYFLYHGQEDGAESFAIQFPRIVNSPDLSVNFLISIRDDGLAKLDRFQGRIPTLFDNRLGIDHLDRSAARHAITQPIEQFNRLYAAGRQRVSVEPELVEAVLDQLETGEVKIGEAGRGGVIKGQAAEAQIETPYLQLVMNRLWEEDVRAGSHHALRLKTLKETLGGAQRIVRTHLDAAMKALTRKEQDVAAHVFHYLVTPSGAKIAHTIPDLASYSGLPQEKLLPVMERLSSADVRILRGVAPPPDRSDAPRYEIFHDVLAAAILDWRQRYKDKKQATRIRIGVAALFVMMVAALVFVAIGKIRENTLAKITRTQEGEIAKAEEEIAKAKQRAQLDELALKYKDQPRYEKALAVLVSLTSDDAEERAQALENLQQLASNGQIPTDLLPVVFETVEANEPLKAAETRKVVEAGVYAHSDVPVPSSKLAGRVYIHIREDQPQQRKMAQEVKRILEAKGLVVPGIERVSNGPFSNELRFFRSDEDDEAKDITGYLRENIGNTEARYIKGYDKSAIIRPRHYELWFGAPKRETPEPQGDKEHVSMRFEVIDGQTNKSIAGAELYVKSIVGISFEYKVRTNANGVVTLNDIPRTRVSIAVTAKGFYDRGVKGDIATLGRNYVPNPSAQVRPERRVFKFELTRQTSAR